MIKNSLKNFGKNLIYLFVPMGLVYLFILIAVFVFVEAAMRDVGTAFAALTQLMDDSLQQSSASLQQFVSYAISQIDWNGNFWDTLKTVINTNWIGNTFRGFMETLSQSTEGFEQDLTAIVARLADGIIADISVAGSLCALGVLSANFATRFILRSKVAKRNAKQFVIAHTLVPVAQTALLTVSLVLIATIRLYSLLVFVAFAVLTSLLSLCSSYLIYRDNGLQLKEVLTGKNILQHLASMGIILLINAAVAVVLFFVNKIIAVLLLIPLLIYSANIVDVTTDRLVRTLAEQKAARPAQADIG